MNTRAGAADSQNAELNQAFMQARALQAENRLDEARHIYEQILLRIPHHAESLMLLGSISYQKGDEIQGDAYVERAVAVFREFVRREPNSAAYQGPLANLLLARGKQAESEQICRHLQLQLNPIRMTPQQFVERRSAAILSGLPPMIINTVPKSASESIWNQLAEGLGLAQAHVSIGLFPDCCLVGPRVKALAQGGLIVKEHIPATPYNLEVLAAEKLTRLVFHVRDPRQATLSWAHFVKDDVAMRLMAPIWRRIVPKAEVLAQDLPSVIDWAIDHYLPLIVNFIQGWIEVDAEKRHGLSVLFMDFETFRQTPEAYLEAVLRFYGVPQDRFRAQAAAEAQVVHLRKGEIDEWRGVFTPEQAERAWRAIPPAMAERFGWQA